MKVRTLVGVGMVWAISLVGVGLWAQAAPGTSIDVQAQAPTIIAPGRPGVIVSGDDIGFQLMSSPNTPAGAVAGRWMVRVGGEWRVAAAAMQVVPMNR